MKYENVAPAPCTRGLDLKYMNLLYINERSFIRVSRGSEGVWKGLGHDIYIYIAVPKVVRVWHFTVIRIWPTRVHCPWTTSPSVIFAFNAHHLGIGTD